MDRFVGRIGEVGHGTQVAASIRATYRGHDRVFVISDMQTMSDGTNSALPADVPLYGFNLGGYAHTAYPVGTPNRHEFGGLTDATFRMVPLIEAGRTANWPWLPSSRSQDQPPAGSRSSDAAEHRRSEYGR